MAQDQRYFINKDQLSSILGDTATQDIKNNVYTKLKTYKTSVNENVGNPDEYHVMQLESMLYKNTNSPNSRELAENILKKSREYHRINNIDVENYKNRVDRDSTYIKVKSAKENVTSETIRLLEGKDEAKLDKHLLQLDKVEEAFYAKRDSYLSNIMYYGFPLSHLCPTLGLISAAAAGATVFITPLVLLIYSSIFTYNNIKKDGLNTTENKILLGLTALAAVVTVGSIIGFAGVTLPFGGAMLLPLVSTMCFGLFCYGSILEDRRNNEALDLLKVKIKSLTQELSKYQSLVTAGTDTELNTKKVKLIQKNIDVMLFEYTNIVRTIKFPVTKNDHIKLLNETRIELAQITIDQVVIKNQIDPTINNNIKLLMQTDKNLKEISRLEEDIAKVSLDPEKDIKKLKLQVLKRSRFDFFKSDNKPDSNKIYQATLLSHLLKDLDNSDTKEQAKVILKTILPIIGDTKGVDTVIIKKPESQDDNDNKISKVISTAVGAATYGISDKVTDLADNLDMISKNVYKVVANSGIPANSAFLQKYLTDQIDNMEAENPNNKDITKLKDYVKQLKNLSGHTGASIFFSLGNESSSVGALNSAKNHVMSYFLRDSTYYTFNLALITLTTLIAIAPIISLPIFLTPPVMIGIAATVGAFMLITSTQWYMTKGKIQDAKERLAPNVGNFEQYAKQSKDIGKSMGVSMKNYQQPSNSQKVVTEENKPPSLS